MNRLRVAHVVLNLEAGGLERVVADIIRTTDPDRFEQHLVVLEFPGRYAEGLERFASIHQAPRLPAWTVLWPSPLTRMFRSIAPDVVHTHSGVWNKASLAARHAGVRTIVHTEHGRAKYPEPWSDRMADRLAAHRTDVVVSVSEAAAAHISGAIVSDPRKLRIVKNGIDTITYAPGDADDGVRREWSIPDGAPIIGSIGRFDPIKGYDIVLSAFARLVREWADGPVPVLVLVGDGPERQALESQARMLGIEKHVRLPGWRSDVVHILRCFSLFTMGSRSEGTSISLLEAMSVGICPVVTDVGGNAAVLGPALAHRLVPTEAADLLADAWTVALHDRTRCEQDAVHARRRVETEYALRSMVKAYEDIYLAGTNGCP